MQIPAFANHGTSGSAGFQQSLDAGVILYGITRPAGTAKGDQFGVFEGLLGQPLEKQGFFGIALRKTALDIIQTKFIEFAGNQKFVLDRKTNPFGLHSIPQCGIVNLDFFHS